MDDRLAVASSSSNSRRRRIQIPEEQPQEQHEEDITVTTANVVNALDCLPSTLLIHDILLKLDLFSLCSLSCTSKSMRLVASQALSLLPSLHLSDIALDARSLNSVARRCTEVKSVQLNCLNLSVMFVAVVLRRNLEELSLINCRFLTSPILGTIGDSCSNLRRLVLEFASWSITDEFKNNLFQTIRRCLFLESLSIKIRAAEINWDGFESIEFFLPKSITSLKLHPVVEQHSIHLINNLRVGRDASEAENLSYPLFPFASTSMIQHLSLVLDVMADELIISITNSLPALVELDLEDRPAKEPSLNSDLTNSGIQSLNSLRQLVHLSLVRSRKNRAQVSFKRINDMGMFLLSEGCKNLESVSLCGFSKVSDAGFASILHSCRRLQKFEIRNASLLSDLAFHDLTGAPCSLVEVKLLSCNLITSDTVEKLAYSRSLELLDLSGCRSVADACLNSIAFLSMLTTLNLSGADITDGGLSVLGQGSLSVKCLSLRGCKRITDRGISFLLCGEGTFGKTLTDLDLSFMPGVSDKSIHAIATAGIKVTQLCIRNCFNVTDFAIELLAKKGMAQGGNRQLQRLDLFNCTGLSAGSLGWLSKPTFRRLLWLGVGHTRWARQRDTITGFCTERPWLTVCFDGCEIGCYDGWPYHGVGKWDVMMDGNTVEH